MIDLKDETMMPPQKACSDFEAELPAYLEGESRPALLAHAAQCEFCRCILADVEQIRAASLDLMEDPPDRMWKHIRTALVEEGIIASRQGLWQRWASRWREGFLRHPVPVGAVAAAILIAAFFLGMPGQSFLHRRSALPQVSNASASRREASSAIDQLRQTVSGLQRAFNANASRLDPSLKVTYQRSLESLNQEIRDCRRSLPGDPDGLTQHYLASAYMQKAELLQSALEYDLR